MKKLVSVAAGKTLQVFGYNGGENITPLIPFSGQIPMFDLVDEEEYRNAIKGVMYVEELPEKYQAVTYLGERVFNMISSFRDYLSDRGIEVEKFLAIPGNEKANYLISWLEDSCLDINSIRIQFKEWPILI